MFVLRAAWRLSAGRRLPPAATGWLRVAGTGMHGLLYALMAAQIVLGFLFRWAQGEPFAFFGLFDAHADRRSTASSAASSAACTTRWPGCIIVLALLHALAGLFHHYFLRDGVLRRMLWSR